LLRVASEATHILERVGDDRGLGRAWLFIGFVEGGHFCHNKNWEEAAERALLHYRRAGFPAGACLGQLSAALYYGPAHAQVAIARCDELLGDDAAGLPGRAQVLRYLAGLRAMTGDFESARAMSDEACAIFHDFGQTGAAMHSGAIRGDVELLAGAPARAAGEYEVLCRYCQEGGELGFLATLATDLAEALLELGEHSDAERWTAIAEEHAASDDVGAQFAWRAVRAKTLAHTGRLAEAEQLAREAVELAEPTDALNKRAAVLLSLAEVLRLGGKDQEADETAGRGAQLFELKGNAAALARLE
jgi:tetratricopeptide (TPR) repeat protein